MAVATTYNLAPVPRWLFTDLTGLVLSNGTMFTYEDLNHAIHKPVYQDPEGMNPWTQPVPFQLNGMPNGEFFWASDSDYYLAIFDQFDVPQFTVSHYNAPFANEINPAPKFFDNYVRNAQFTYWSNTNTFPGVSQSQTNADYIADDWLFFRNNLNATCNISQVVFNLGQTDVPFNPYSYLHYECTNAGAGGETFKRISQQYSSVQTLSGQQLTGGFWAKSSSQSQIIFDFIQSFGTGGSPSPDVATTLLTATLSTTWKQYFGTVTLPGVSGKSLGSNNNSYLSANFELPLNQTASIDFCNVQFQLGPNLSDFPYITVDDQLKKLNTTYYGIPKTGDIKISLRVTADTGWIACTGNTIGNQASGSTYAGLFTKALFVLIWTNVSNTYAPIFDSGGSPSTRGVSAEADYDANKRLNLTATLGAVFANVNGSGFALAQTTGAATATQSITINAANLPPHVHGFTASIGTATAGDAGTTASYGSVPSAGATNDGGFANNPLAVSVSTYQPTIFYSVFIKL